MQTINMERPPIGCVPQADGAWRVRVWAPEANSVELSIVQGPRLPMKPEPYGYWSVLANGPAGMNYWIVVDGQQRPDPASRFQPDGVHGHSQAVNLQACPWTDGSWKGIPLDRMVFYELHVGTFTEEGTFAAAIDRLDTLKELGVTTIEVLPVAQFPGDRNWGYDGAHPFAVQNSYGGPQGLMQFVDACHTRGMAVCLDVVYNHLGPEGNYLWGLAPYFTDRYRTPWGCAINFDGQDSDDVRHYFIENALQWLRDYHIDVLRLDATHAIYDNSSYPFLKELAEAVEQFSIADGRRRYLIAESDANQTRLIRPRAVGGFGLDGQWCDEFHHAVHALLTGETDGYYVDYGRLVDLAKSYENAYVYTGQQSRFRGRRHGESTAGLLGAQFVVCLQNHDQVGNRMLGDRLTATCTFAQLKLAAAALMLSPFVPMLFMGEEYGEEQPFQYFVSHGDEALVEAVRDGRREEFESFSWQGEVPDPQSEETFQRSKLAWNQREEGTHGALRNLYKRLIALRNEEPALRNLNREGVRAVPFVDSQCLVLLRRSGERLVIALMNFSDTERTVPQIWENQEYHLVLSTDEACWQGKNSHPVELEGQTKIPPHSCTIFRKET